jgi:L-cysteine desulfidase
MAQNFAASITFSTLIRAYIKIQSSLVQQVRALAANISTATPGSFILLQFQMSQVTQIGESISNLIAQVNSVINHAVSNQRVQ